MIWGEASGAQRLMPAKSAYGGTNAADEQAAFDASMTAEINFFDTAAMYSAGGSERRLGELAEGKDVVIATKFPPKPLRRTEDMPAAGGEPGQPAAQLDRPVSTSLSVTSRGHPGAHGAHGRRGRAGQDQSGRRQPAFSAAQMRTAYQALARRGIPLASNQSSTPCCIGSPRPTGCWISAVNSASP